jgi:hypothetical protein
MRNYSHLKGDLLFRAYSLPVPRNISSQFITLVVKWVECSGEEWTIDRLKSIKLDLIRIRSGLVPVSDWVKSGRRSHFGGIIGVIERKSLSSDKWFNSMIQLIQVYSWFIAKEVTPKQAKKFLDGVHANPPPKDSVHLANQLVGLGFAKANLRPVNYMAKPRPLVEFLPSPNRRAPLPGRSVPEDKGVIDSLQYLWFTEKGRAHYQQFKPIYDSVMDGLDWWETWMYKATGPYGPMPNISDSFLVGRIGLIQEPGYKLRAVANPGRVFQRALEPLGDTLYRTLKALPWDCTFDQTKAIPALQECLSSGCVVHSIDLSGATDYFPLDVQLHLLRKIFPQTWVDIFSEISQGSWEMPGFGQVSWTRGQPLGLYPSFGAFALTHGCLLLGLLGREPYDSQFFVLGDDVVILDTELAQRYHTLMGMMHCPISESKTISSTKLCEFGGKIVTANAVIPQYKWRAISDDSFIDICRNLGRRSMKLLRSRQRHVVESLCDLPECLGGFGWNSKGRTLESRIQDHPWLFDPPKFHGRVTSYTGSSIRNLMASESYCLTLKDTPNLVCSLRGDLDQRSQALTKTYLGNHLVPWYSILGKNLDEVLTSNLLECDLPIKASRDRTNTLSIWERRLARTLQQVTNPKQ